MNKAFVLTALVFAILSTVDTPAARASRRLLQPKFCFGTVPVACTQLKTQEAQTLRPATTIGQTTPVLNERWLDKNVWKIRLSADYNFLQTNTLGTQGSGKAQDYRIRVTPPGDHFDGGFGFSRYNIEVPRLRFCPTCGYVYEDENDDYDEEDAFFDWLFGYDECSWGIGPRYYYFHPIYAQGSYNMSGAGLGIVKLPYEGSTYSILGSADYFPNVSGSYNAGNTQITGGYQIWKYEAGVNYHPNLNTPLSFQVGLKGETWIGKGQASNYRVIGGFLGTSFTW